MDAILKALKDSNTSLAGVILGVLTYAQSVGAALPQTSEEWTAALVSAALAAFGVVSKDGGKD